MEAGQGQSSSAGSRQSAPDLLYLGGESGEVAEFVAAEPGLPEVAELLLGQEPGETSVEAQVQNEAGSQQTETGARDKTDLRGKIQALRNEVCAQRTVLYAAA